MNEAFFKSVHISNFKSLKDVTLSDCKRINLLIGKPNVGKSNILEAIGLFSLPYIKYNKSKKITQFVRLENLAELFFDGNADEEINIKTNDNSFINVNYLKDKREVNFKMELKQSFCFHRQVKIDSLFNVSFPVEKLLGINTNYLLEKVKYYKFPQIFLTKKQKNNFSFLIPPFGVNLLETIEENKLSKDIAKIFSDYGLKLLLDRVNNTIRVMKLLKEENEMISFPYSSIADTLQRVIFFKTAIASNKNSILLFEEPEAHCFPPYISYFTRDVIYSETNQFFIATHSPYVLNDFLEYKREDVAIFIADFKDGQTVINRLTDEEVDEVYEYGIDVFFNYERFTR